MDSPRVYRISPRRRAFLYGSWALFAVPLLIGGLVTGEPGLLVAGVLVSAIMLPLLLWVDLTAKLILTAEGIETRQVGARLQSSWANVAGLRLVPGSEGFVLREPMSGSGPQRFASASHVRIRGAALYDDVRLQLISELRFIPIEAFAYWLKHGDLRAAIARVAPDLESRTDPSGGPVAGTQGPDRPSKSLLLLLIVLISVIIGLSIGLNFVPPETQRVTLRVLTVPVGLAFAVIGTRNFVAAIQLFRARRWGGGVLWITLALVQVCIVLAILGELLGSSAKP
jgi:hypothetical protein